MVCLAFDSYLSGFQTPLRVTIDHVIHKRSLEKRGDCAEEALLQQPSSWNEVRDVF